MEIYRCDHCRYTFPYPLGPRFCPGCGKEPVRNATKNEIKYFHREQQIISEGIRTRLYAIKG